MSLKFTAKISSLSEHTIELCGEALTSSRPPLTEHSIQRIAEIREARLKDLVGADKFQATKFFEAMDRVPPIEGLRTSALLTMLGETDFSVSSVLDTLENLPSDATNTRETPNEWGFVTETARVEKTNSEVKITIDEHKASRDAAWSVAEMYLILTEFSDPSVRNALIEDFGKVVPLRLDFDIS